MAVEEHNAKIEHTELGNKKIGKALWPIFYGVELEYEINIKDELIQKWLKDSYSGDEQGAAKALDDGVQGSRRVSKVMNYVWSIIYPKVKSFGFIKRDGSLKNGLEVVSSPMTIDAHKESWPDFLNLAQKSSLHVKNNCGMHIHASREVLTNLQCGKILYFLHHADNRGFITKVAGRVPPENYANYSLPKKITDINKHSDSSKKENRYDSLNTTGDQTIEFRFFLSTLDFNRLMANLQFCAALIDFSWPCNSSVKDFNFKGFIKYMLIPGKRKEYSYLYELLEKLKYINDGRKKLPVPALPNKNIINGLIVEPVFKIRPIEVKKKLESVNPFIKKKVVKKVSAAAKKLAYNGFNDIVDVDDGYSF